ncbi:MAG TPA: hypothetical protein VE010_10175 [Thermoanaerobaculia bacterium]|nr:hypothetical protein [Thermoanaerobaculia bacterium]
MKIAALLLTVTLASSAFGGEIFLPATYRGPGAFGAVWRTEISVSNISLSTPVPIHTTITLHRENGDPVSIPMLLSQHEVISVRDALRDWFNVEEGGGIVRVTCDDPNARIAINARVYNLGGGGEFGQGIPGVRPERLLSDVYLPGLSGVDGNRTNVGISNPHNAAAIAWVTLHDTSGSVRGSIALGIPPRSFRQINDIFAFFNVGPLNASMVRVSGFNTTIYAYASVVRNDTGDATYIAPAE